MAYICDIKFVIVDERDQGGGSYIGWLWISRFKCCDCQLLPFSFNLSKCFAHSAFYGFLVCSVFEVRLEIHVKFFTAKIGELPPVIAIKYSCIIARKLLELLAAQSVVIWFARWPLEGLKTVPNIVSYKLLFFFLRFRQTVFLFPEKTFRSQHKCHGCQKR